MNLSGNTGTFTTTLGNFTKIEVTAPNDVSGTGWSGDGSDAHGTVAFTVDGAAATQAKKDDVVTVSVTPAEGYSTNAVSAMPLCQMW